MPRTSHLDDLCIIYPPGAHGSFLKMLLNYAAGINVSKGSEQFYDFVVTDRPPIFTHTHMHPGYTGSSERTINIRVRESSYLKYLAMVLHRSPPGEITIEELEQDTFSKLDSQLFFRMWLPDLITVSNMTSGSVPRRFLRAWMRDWFFTENGEKLTRVLKYNVVDNAGAVVDFEDFYTGNIVNKCIDILSHYNVPIVNTDLEKFLPEFYLNLKYKTIDKQAFTVIDHIKLRQCYEIPPTNFFVEAWIDNWLIYNIGITPIMKDSYFTNTQQIFETYQI